MPINVTLTHELPKVDANVVLKIDYDETTGSAARAFEIAAELIRTLDDIDRVLSKTIHSELQTALVVEDLQKSSLKIFLRNVIKAVPDEALKEADLKKLVGHFLLKGKYAVLEWLDTPKEEPKQIADLTDKIVALADETDIRRLPDYPSPNKARLAQPLDRLQETKKKFRNNESLTITLGEDEYSVDLDKTWLPSETLEPEKDGQHLVNEQDQYLIIGKPDFIGPTKWSFQHGKRSVSYLITDEDWLNDFRAGKFPLKPGDALRVRIRFEHKYDIHGDLIEAKEEITKVISVIESDPNAEPSLFE